MSVQLPRNGTVEAFALIVDINGFTMMVDAPDANGVVQFASDVLMGGVKAVEACDGSVVGFMGDAFLAVLPDADSTFGACVTVARDLDRQCEYISGIQARSPHAWPFAVGGPGLKISIEYGRLGVTEISSAYLGSQPLLVGTAVNYAARISAGGSGNRCLFGPRAHANGLGQFSHTGPEVVKGKQREPDYLFYQLDLSDVWREGDRGPEHDSYWG